METCHTSSLHLQMVNNTYNMALTHLLLVLHTVYPKKYARRFCFAVLCCGFTLIDFPLSIRLTSLALWQSNDCPSASKATLMNMDKYFMWIHYERLHNHNKAKHNKTVCIFLGIYCIYASVKWVSTGSGNVFPCSAPSHYLNQHWLILNPLGTNLSEIEIKIQRFSFMKMHLKMPSVKSLQFCLGEMS